MSDDVDDDAIRSRLHEATGSPSSSVHETLSALGPAMRAARRRRQLSVASMGTAALLVLGVGAVLAASLIGGTSDERLVTSTDPGPPSSELLDSDDPSDPTDVDGVDGGLAPATTPVPSTTPSTSTTLTSPSTVAPPPSTTTLSEPDSSPGSSTPTAPTPTETTEPPPAPVAPDPPPTPSTTTPSTTVAPTTTPPTASTVAPTTSPPTTVASTTRTISSRCGSIRISFDDQSVQLLGTSPEPGFIAEVTSGGPEVEVEFESDDDDDDDDLESCEISAEVDDGVLEIEVDD